MCTKPPFICRDEFLPENDGYSFLQSVISIIGKKFSTLSDLRNAIKRCQTNNMYDPLAMLTRDHKIINQSTKQPQFKITIQKSLGSVFKEHISCKEPDLFKDDD